MKKVFSIVMSLVLVMCMSVTAFAAGGFVSSPSANQAPTIVESKNSNSNCSGTVVVTSYANRATLDDTTRTIFEQATATIQGTTDLTKLNKELAKMTNDPSNLAVSDIFNLSVTDHPGHSEHGSFDITLRADTLKNFVALLCFIDGKWVVVEDAKVTNNGTHLEFTEKGMVPYAIVVNSKGTSSSPETSDSGIVTVCLVIMAMSGAAFVYFSRKVKA